MTDAEMEQGVSLERISARKLTKREKVLRGVGLSLARKLTEAEEENVRLWNALEKLAGTIHRQHCGEDRKGAHWKCYHATCLTTHRLMLGVPKRDLADVMRVLNVNLVPFPERKRRQIKIAGSGAWPRP